MPGLHGDGFNGVRSAAGPGGSVGKQEVSALEEMRMQRCHNAHPVVMGYHLLQAKGRAKDRAFDSASSAPYPIQNQ